MKKISVFSKKLGKKVLVKTENKKHAAYGWVKSAWSKDSSW